MTCCEPLKLAQQHEDQNEKQRKQWEEEAKSTSKKKITSVNRKYRAENQLFKKQEVVDFNVQKLMKRLYQKVINNQDVSNFETYCENRSQDLADALMKQYYGLVRKSQPSRYSFEQEESAGSIRRKLYRKLNIEKFKPPTRQNTTEISLDSHSLIIIGTVTFEEDKLRL